MAGHPASDSARRHASRSLRRGCPVRARSGEEVALAQETPPEQRRYYRVAHHRHVVRRVVEAERNTLHQQRGADLNLVGAGGAGAWA